MQQAFQSYGEVQQFGGPAIPNVKVFSKAPNLNTNEIKLIVDGLNRPPFMQHLSMVEFDDKAPLELLEMVNRVFTHLDKTHESVDMQKETQEKTEERVCGFLKVLGYPSDFNPSYCRDIVHGEKRTLQHILFWLLSRLPDLQRKAYTAKFLVPLQIPDEYMHDEDMRNILQIYKDLQAEFQAVHSNTEALRQESMNPAELKKEITQLEQEKEQLLTKINLFKNRGDTNDFQQLLDATSKLRKEQEQDARLNEKERELTQMIEMSEHQLLSVRQRLMDAQKVARDNLGPEQMLNNLRNETRQNRDHLNDMIGRELNDKKDRLQRTEMILAEPQTTQAELERLTADKNRLQRECQVLENKIQPEQTDDKLAIYRSQAKAVQKKKEQKTEEFKRLETEKVALEKSLAEREDQYQKLKGTKYLKRDDFRQYAANLRDKNAQHKQRQKSLEEFKAEVKVLERTCTILKGRAGNVDEFLRDLERKKGIAGYSSVEDQIQGVSEIKEQVDNTKSQSLQELTQLVQQIEQEVKEKKTKLAPGIKKLRTLRQRMTDIEEDYQTKKKDYDAVVQQMEVEKEQITKDMGSQFQEYKESESKFHSNNVQADIFETFQKRIQREAQYISNPDKRLMPDVKTFHEYFKIKQEQQETVMRELRETQRHIKDNSENYSNQMKIFKDLRYLLDVKTRTAANGGDGLVGYQDTQARGFDRFVVRD